MDATNILPFQSPFEMSHLSLIVPILSTLYDIFPLPEKKNLNIYYANNIQNLSNKNYHLHYWNENCMITDKVCSFT